MDTTAALLGLARARVADDRLPRCGANRITAKFGDSTVCEVCERAVAWSVPMYVLSFRIDDAAREIVMHLPCFMAWSVERAKLAVDTQAPLPPPASAPSVLHLP